MKNILTIKTLTKITCMISCLALFPSCKFITQKNEVSEDGDAIKGKPFTFALELDGNRFKVATFGQEKPGSVADVSINAIQIKDAGPKELDNPNGFTSEEPTFLVSLFYRPEFQLCLPKKEIKLGEVSEGSCATFREVCEHAGWGLLKEETADAPTCACNTTNVQVADFRNAKDFTPFCDKDRRPVETEKSSEPPATNHPATPTDFAYFKSICEKDLGKFDGTNAANPLCQCAAIKVSFESVFKPDSVVNEGKFKRSCNGIARAACLAIPGATMSEILKACQCGKAGPIGFAKYYKNDTFDVEAFKKDCSNALK